MSNDTRGCLEQLDFRIPTIDQPLQNLPTSKHPLGQLLRRNSVRILSIIQPRNQRRTTSSTTTFVKRPTNQGTVLVVIQPNGVDDVSRDTVLEGAEVVVEKGGGFGLG